MTAERGNYICVPKDTYYGNADFYGQREEDTGWSSWMHDGRTESEFNDPSQIFQDISDAYRVVEIIPAVQAQEPTLEFRIRVLEKENQILTRLLMKDGKL